MTPVRARQTLPEAFFRPHVPGIEVRLLDRPPMDAIQELNAQERLRALEDIQRKSIGEATPLVCRECYTLLDKECICGRNEWTDLGLVIIELRLELDAA